MVQRGAGDDARFGRVEASNEREDVVRVEGQGRNPPGGGLRGAAFREHLVANQFWRGHRSPAAGGQAEDNLRRVCPKRWRRRKAERELAGGEGVRMVADPRRASLAPGRGGGSLGRLGPEREAAPLA